MRKDTLSKLVNKEIQIRGDIWSQTGTLFRTKEGRFEFIYRRSSAFISSIELNPAALTRKGDEYYLPNSETIPVNRYYSGETTVLKPKERAEYNKRAKALNH